MLCSIGSKNRSSAFRRGRAPSLSLAMGATPTAGLLATRRGRLLTFSLLYLSEGIPFGFSAIALTVYLRQSGIGLAEIGAFTGSLYAPWAFKWAWAPIVDLIRIRRFGHRRFWIMAAQVMMIIT